MNKYENLAGGEYKYKYKYKQDYEKQVMLRGGH
jgi:hypothetical protein